MALDTSVSFDGFTAFVFEPKDALDQFNSEFQVKHQNHQTSAKIYQLLKTQARMMLIFLDDVIEQSQYNNKLPRALDNFLYHLRNGAAHNGKFLLRRRGNEIAEWRGKTIDQSMNDREIFGTFMCPADVLLLIVDVSAEMKRIDETAVTQGKPSGSDQGTAI